MQKTMVDITGIDRVKLFKKIFITISNTNNGVFGKSGKNKLYKKKKPIWNEKQLKKLVHVNVKEYLGRPIHIDFTTNLVDVTEFDRQCGEGMFKKKADALRCTFPEYLKYIFPSDRRTEVRVLKDDDYVQTAADVISLMQYDNDKLGHLHKFADPYYSRMIKDDDADMISKETERSENGKWVGNFIRYAAITKKDVTDVVSSLKATPGNTKTFLNIPPYQPHYISMGDSSFSTNDNGNGGKTDGAPTSNGEVQGNIDKFMKKKKNDTKDDGSNIPDDPKSYVARGGLTVKGYTNKKSLSLETCPNLLAKGSVYPFGTVNPTNAKDELKRYIAKGKTEKEHEDQGIWKYDVGNKVSIRCSIQPDAIEKASAIHEGREAMDKEHKSLLELEKLVSKFKRAYSEVYVKLMATKGKIVNTTDSKKDLKILKKKLIKERRALLKQATNAFDEYKKKWEEYRSKLSMKHLVLDVMHLVWWVYLINSTLYQAYLTEQIFTKSKYYTYSEYEKDKKNGSSMLLDDLEGCDPYIKWLELAHVPIFFRDPTTIQGKEPKMFTDKTEPIAESTDGGGGGGEEGGNQDQNMKEIRFYMLSSTDSLYPDWGVDKNYKENAAKVNLKLSPKELDLLYSGKAKCKKIIPIYDKKGVIMKQNRYTDEYDENDKSNTFNFKNDPCAQMVVSRDSAREYGCDYAAMLYFTISLHKRGRETNVDFGIKIKVNAVQESYLRYSMASNEEEEHVGTGTDATMAENEDFFNKANT